MQSGKKKPRKANKECAIRKIWVEIQAFPDLLWKSHRWRPLSTYSTGLFWGFPPDGVEGATALSPLPHSAGHTAWSAWQQAPPGQGWSPSFAFPYYHT